MALFLIPFLLVEQDKTYGRRGNTSIEKEMKMNLQSEVI